MNNAKLLTPSPSSRQELGKQGEDEVVAFLKKEGYCILERNYVQRCGEIDIIARKDAVIAFIEVKLRTKNYFNTSQVVTYSKQQKIIKTARSYAYLKKLSEAILRFDVALVQYQDYTFDITYIPNAFTGS